MGGSVFDTTVSRWDGWDETEEPEERRTVHTGTRSHSYEEEVNVIPPQLPVLHTHHCSLLLFLLPSSSTSALLPDARHLSSPHVYIVLF